MKPNVGSKRHGPRPAGADAGLPARLSIERHGKPLHVIVGLSRVRTLAMTAELTAAWLAGRFGCCFVEARPGDDGNLANAVFYDELARLFRGKVMIGVIGLEGEAEGALQLVPEAGPIVFRRQGLAHAFCNDASGRTQVTFDHLPGALDFFGRPAMRSRHAEVIAWYGFGEVGEGHGDAMARLRSLIRHGTVNSDLRIELA
ncbi:MAG: hypothetical protein K2Y27_05730 [Xanthobacteraceae bacterium]|nr:hypothetical protein [Xanthobacteraceae bacterium]